MRCSVPSGPASILGGLPVIADVTFSRGDGWVTDDTADVDCLYWMKRDGSKGKPIPEHMYDRLPDYWECDVIEAVTDHLCYQQWERQQLGALAMILVLVHARS